jgi:mechanosensitive ion channel-like protein
MWQQVEQSLIASMGRVFTKIATLLPGILAFVLAVLVFLIIAWLAASLIRRVLLYIKFDERTNTKATTLSEWAPRHTPTTLITRIVFWSWVVIGVLVGLSAFEAASAESGISAYVFAYVPRVIGATVLLFLGTVIGRFLSRSVLISAVNMNLQYARLLAAGVRWLVFVLTAAMVLDHLAIGGEIVDLAFGILFGGIVFALALAVGLGSRDLVSRSLEREASRPVETPVEEKLHHF